MQLYPNPKPRKALWMEEPTRPSRPELPKFLEGQEYDEWKANLSRDQRDRLLDYQEANRKYDQDKMRYETLEKIQNTIVVLTIIIVIGSALDALGLLGGSAETGLCFSMYC